MSSAFEIQDSRMIADIYNQQTLGFCQKFVLSETMHKGTDFNTTGPALLKQI